MDSIGTFINSVGFPIFVAVYVLCRLEPAIKGLEKTIGVLTYVIAKQNGIDYEEAKKVSGKNGSC